MEDYSQSLGVIKSRKQSKTQMKSQEETAVSSSQPKSGKVKGWLFLEPEICLWWASMPLPRWWEWQFRGLDFWEGENMFKTNIKNKTATFLNTPPGHLIPSLTLSYFCNSLLSPSSKLTLLDYWLACVNDLELLPSSVSMPALQILFWNFSIY